MRERRLREVEARLSRLSVEIEEMQKHADAEAKAEEDRIHASIDEEKSKIIQAAEQEVALAANSARRDLQKYAVELAVATAEKGIRVDTSTDKALVEGDYDTAIARFGDAIRINPKFARAYHGRGVAYFHKQWGGRTSKAGGRILDGRTWDEFPRTEVRVATPSGVW